MNEDGGTKTSREAVSDLVKWSEGLPLWQRDALRRLYQQGGWLSKDDKEELLRLCKSPHGLLGDKRKALPIPTPLVSKHVPTATPGSDSISLYSVESVKRVNALADGQNLSFGATGLTVVYGNNATGKSGYARILKSVCRARSGEQILHNVYEEPPKEPATARILYQVGTASPVSIDWKDGAEMPEELSSVSVFDSKCAPFHVEGKNGAFYTPQPLPILRALAEVCSEVRTLLQNEYKALEAQKPPILEGNGWNPDTSAGRILSTISETTNLQEARRLAELSDAESGRLHDLREQLKSDPTELATIEDAKRRRLESLLRRLLSAVEILGDDALTLYQQLLEDEATKEETARVASIDLFSDAPLPHIGSPIWRALWEAARKYSEHEALPGRVFPFEGEDARCVLCQQELSPDARKRLSRFESFVKENTQEAVRKASQSRITAKRAIDQAQLSREQCREDLRLLQDELSRPDLAKLTLRFFRCASLRRGRANVVNAGDPFPRLRALDAGVCAEISALVGSLTSRVQQLRESGSSEERKKLQKEQHELADRELLKELLPTIHSEIERLEMLAKLSKAITDSSSNKITRKATELADELVTDAWRDRFAREVSQLDIHHLRIELCREQSSQGTANFRVVLLRDRTAKLGVILSEGEYRTIALAAFLSELALSANKSAIVFDDPVSSLDHEYLDSVAKRLAEEAATGRQVIVFTHDVFLLESLTRHGKDLGASIKFRTVSRRPDGTRAGIVESGVPTTVAPCDVLAEGIRRQVAQCSGLFEAGKMVEWNNKTEGFSIQLRKAWERAVAEALEPVVKRFDARIDTKHIWKIAALEEVDCREMREAYKRCSELNHEACASLRRPDPTPDEYFSEVKVLIGWHDRVKAKQDDAYNKRSG